MTYRVLWPDGRSFGPADVQTLVKWAGEGRIAADTELLEVESDRRLIASDLPELEFLAAPAPVLDNAPRTEFEPHSGFGVPDEYPLTGGSPYPVGYSSSRVQSDVRTAWGLAMGGLAATFVVGYCCSCAVPGALAVTGAGIYHANRAKRKGEEGAQTVLVVSIGVLCFQVLLIAAVILFFSLGFWRSFRRMP